MNIKNGILYAENVKKALIKEDPKNKESSILKMLKTM